MQQSRQVQFARRPVGAPNRQDFELVAVDLPDLSDGEVQVENTWMSVDPYMRLPMTGLGGLHGSVEIGDVLTGGAVGKVIQSRNANLPEGTHVLSGAQGWREAYVSDSAGLTPIDPALAPVQHFLGILGLTGLTAYTGVERVLKPKEGETLFVSSAAGAVGMVVAQLAKLRGARVLGTTGSDEKAAWLHDTLKLDAVANYKTENLAQVIADFAPEGLNHYFDNVGGDHLEAAIDGMARHGHAALCGAIGLYDTDNYRAGPANFFAAIEKGLVLEGHNFGLHVQTAAEDTAALAGLLASGDIFSEETVVDGIEGAVGAFIGMLQGENLGKMLVRLAGS